MSNFKNKTASIVAILFVILFVITSILGFSFYKLYFTGTQSSVLLKTASVLQLPVARVGKYSISYQRLTSTKDAIYRFVNNNEDKRYKEQLPNDEILTESVVSQLILESIIQELADNLKVSVSDNDVKSAFDDLVQSQASSTKNIDDFLWDQYGWHKDEFQKHVIRPALLAQKVSKEYVKQNNGSEDALGSYVSKRMSRSDVVIYLQSVHKPIR